MGKILSVVCCFVLVALCFGHNVKAEEEIKTYELKKGDLSVKITNFGAIVLSVTVPDKNGNINDVVLGYETVDEYKNDTTYFGSIVGRVANRIGGAQFSLDGIEYKLLPNDHGNTLHGGPKGYSKVVWTVGSYREDHHLSLNYKSFDGEEGFPGDLDVTVTYMLLSEKELGIKMEAKPLNKPTPVNLASHSYWNLGGHNSGDILSHEIQLLARKITPVDDNLIPTGEIQSIQGTPYDFLQPRAIGSRLDELPQGYDINYVLDIPTFHHLHPVAIVKDNKSGRKMELFTNAVGVQFYTSNMLDNEQGKGGAVYNKYAAMCLETQGFPDAVNQPNFPSQTVNPGQTYTNIMVYRFTAE